MADFFPPQPITLEMFYPAGYSYGLRSNLFESSEIPAEVKQALAPIVLKIIGGFDGEIALCKITKHLLLVQRFLRRKPELDENPAALAVGAAQSGAA
jgi:hypothetical protein